METLLYPTLARRQLFWGVPRTYGFVVMAGFVVSMLLSAFFIGGLGIFVGIAVGAVLWGLGILITKYDEDFLAVYFVKWFKLGTTIAPGRFSGNKYCA